MNNNDILRRLRYALDINDAEVALIFARVGDDLSPAQVRSWLRREDHGEFELLSELMLCRFLDGSRDSDD